MCYYPYSIMCKDLAPPASPHHADTTPVEALLYR